MHFVDDCRGMASAWRIMAAIGVLTLVSTCHISAQVVGDKPGQVQSQAAPTPSGQIPPDILRRVKAATVQLKVTLPNGSAEGSGFFSTEPGVVLTNAHVLGMFKADSRRPSKVDVVLRSGEKDERTLPGKVLGVDVNSDLAVLRVEGENLPAPLEVGSAEDLLETQAVYIFGFPFGSSLGKAITVSTSSVSSLRRNKAGVLQRVQVNGGMNPGNSGGPVVDVGGRVVGVAVSVLGRTQINFAVPGEAVKTMLAGKVHEITMGHPYLDKDGTTARSAIDLKLIDPLNRVGKVSLLAWAGATAKTRAEAPPPPTAGDPKRQEAIDLTVKNGVASVDLALPAAKEGETYWLQPSYTDGAGKEQKWLPIPWPIKPPLERTPVVLALKYTPDTKNDLEVVTNTTFTLRDSEGEEHTLVVNMKVGILETIGKVSAQGIADVHLKYEKWTLGIKLDNQPVPREQIAQAMNKDLFKVGTDLRIDTRGTLIENKLDLSAVPRGSRAFVTGIAEKIQKSFEAVELTLPGNLTEPNVPWTGQRDLPIDTPGEDEQSLVDMRYKYLGHRRKNNVDEALIDIAGNVKGTKGNGSNLSGRMGGLATVDLDSGRVIQANVTTTIDMDIVLNRRPGKANGKLEVRLTRKPHVDAPPATKEKEKEKDKEKPKAATEN